MKDIEKQITDLVNQKGKSASQITHAFSFIGNGDMATGIKRMADYFKKEGQKIGMVKGAVGGVAISTLIFGMGILIKNKIEENKKHREEGEAILKGLEDGLSD